VFSVISFLVYSWTFITFFYKLSSWVYYLTGVEIAIIFAYAMTVDFFESLLILSGIILLYLFLPTFFVKSDFVVYGTWMAIGYLSVLMAYFIPFFGFSTKVVNPAVWLVISVASAVLLTMVLSRLTFMRKFANQVADRTVVFLLFSFPISVISIVTTVLRIII
jgi:hypothetical protein